MTRLRLTQLATLLLLACAGPSARETRGATIHHDLGVEALRGGRAQEALREFDEAIKLNPRLPDAYLGRGMVYEFAFGKLADAEKDYRQALALRPDYPEAHNNLGQLLAKTGRPDRALGEFDLALGDMMYREPWVARCNKGQTLRTMGRMAEGLAELRNCVGTAPRYCAGRRELGRAFMVDGKPREALEQFNVYADVCKLSADAQLQVAQAKMKVGDVAGARAAFEQCAALGRDQAEGLECSRSLELLK